MKNSRQKNTHTHTKRSIKYIEQKTRNEEKDPRTKTMLEFDHSTACNIKYLAVKKNNEVKPTTRFFSRKMLMFAKLSLISFNYDLLGTFCFPSEKKRKIYEKYMIKIIFPYHVLTDADSTCLHFIFIWKPESSFSDDTCRANLRLFYQMKSIIFLTRHLSSGKNFLLGTSPHKKN